MGAAIAKSGMPREELFFVSKIWVSNYRYEDAKASIDESLCKLGTDYLGLMLLHQAYHDVCGAWRALEEAYSLSPAQPEAQNQTESVPAPETQAAPQTAPAAAPAKQAAPAANQAPAQQAAPAANAAPAQPQQQGGGFMSNMMGAAAGAVAGSMIGEALFGDDKTAQAQQPAEAQQQPADAQAQQPAQPVQQPVEPAQQQPAPQPAK